MKKCFLVGMGNDGYRYRYSFQKNEGFKPLICKFFFRLGFKDEIENYFLKYEGESYKEIKLENLKDVDWNFKNENFDIDIFYGFEEIILIIRTEEKEILIKVVESLFEIKKFPKIKTSKKKK